MKTLLLAPALLLASCGAAVADAPQRSAKAETELTRLLAGKVAGETRSCILQREARDQRNIDERTIIFGAGRSRLYRNDIPGGCPRLDNRSTIIRSSPTNTICSGEIFEVRDSGTGFVYGSCTFGEFTEYRNAR